MAPWAQAPGLQVCTTRSALPDFGGFHQQYKFHGQQLHKSRLPTPAHVVSQYRHGCQQF